MAEAKSKKTTEQDKPAAPPRSFSQFREKVKAARGDYPLYVLPLEDGIESPHGKGNIAIEDPFQIKGYAAFGVLEAIGRAASGDTSVQGLAIAGQIPALFRSLLSEVDYDRLIYGVEANTPELFQLLLDVARHYGISVPEDYDAGELLASLS